MFRFSMRELLLVILVIGLGLGWGLDHARLSSQAATWRHCAGALEQAFRELRWTVSWTEDRNEVEVQRTDGDSTGIYAFYTDSYEPGTKFFRKRPPLDSSKALKEGARPISSP